MGGKFRSDSVASALSLAVNLLTDTCIETAPGPAGTALKLPTRPVSAHGARGAPSSCQDAGLVVVGRQ